MTKTIKTKSTRNEKIDWMLKHQEMWEGLKLPEESPRLEKIAKQMQAEGLYSSKTYWLDILHSVRNLIPITRKVRRTK